MIRMLGELVWLSVGIYLCVLGWVVKRIVLSPIAVFEAGMKARKARTSDKR